MLKSMTAYARQESQGEWGSLIWELRSVNHRYLEISPRLPEELRGLEPQLREMVGQRLKRGKVECSLRYRVNEASSEQLEINETNAKALINACHLLEGMMMNAARLSTLEILRWPGVVKPVETDLAPVNTAALELLNQTLDDMVATREREGDRIREMIEQRTATIVQLSDQIGSKRGEMQQRMRDKLQARLTELQLDVDNNRLEQELVFLAQKQDIDEEIDRLRAHVKEVNNVLRRNEPVGRRLDFLMQELNREANTLGSKAADTETSNASVELKVMIEQMREQIQNLE